MVTWAIMASVLIGFFFLRNRFYKSSHPAILKVFLLHCDTWVQWKAILTAILNAHIKKLPFAIKLIIKNVHDNFKLEKEIVFKILLGNSWTRILKATGSKILSQDIINFYYKV
jgi:hypothetical protein